MHQDCINHAKHSGGRSNAERQRDDCRQCESWAFDELPCGIAEILKQGMHSIIPRGAMRDAVMISRIRFGEVDILRAQLVVPELDQ